MKGGKFYGNIIEVMWMNLLLRLFRFGRLAEDRWRMGMWPPNRGYINVDTEAWEAVNYLIYFRKPLTRNKIYDILYPSREGSEKHDSEIHQEHDRKRKA